MSARRRRAVGLAVAVALAGAAPAHAQHAQGEARSTELACPPEQVPPAGFTDTSGNVHADLIDCAAWHDVTTGTGPDTYSPSLQVRRDQMATFIARLLDTAGLELPGSPPHRFPDVPADGPHTLAVNQLAELGVVGGNPDGTYGPAAPVRRDQMARFINLAIEHATGASRSASGPRFSDTTGNTHEEHINVLAAWGIVAGYGDGTYRPSAAVRRDQMAAFLMRALDLVIDEGAHFVGSVHMALLTGGNELDDSGVEVEFNQGQPEGLGIAYVSVHPDQGEICYGFDAFVDSPVTAAHIHRGAMDATGPPVLTLVTDAEGMAGECLTDPDLAAEIDAQPDGFYVNVHTEAYPDGAVRGQLGILVYGPTASWGNVVTGDGERGAGERGATGGGWVQVHEPTAVMCSLAFAEHATGPFTGHALHEAAMGSNGPAVAEFAAPGPFQPPGEPSPAWVGGGCRHVAAETATGVAAAPSSYYLSLATETHEAGALRGQLDGVTLEVPLTGDDGGEPGAGGLAVLELGLESGRLCSYIETDATGPFTGAHIHEGREGETGRSVVAVPAPGEDGTASGCLRRDPEEVAALVFGSFAHYLDVHTDGHPGGAVRGQLGSGLSTFFIPG